MLRTSCAAYCPCHYTHTYTCLYAPIFMANFSRILYCFFTVVTAIQYFYSLQVENSSSSAKKCIDLPMPKWPQKCNAHHRFHQQHPIDEKNWRHKVKKATQKSQDLLSKTINKSRNKRAEIYEFESFRRFLLWFQRTKSFINNNDNNNKKVNTI